MERMKVVLGHLSGSQQPRVWAPSPCRASLSGPDDVVVVHGRRTPIAKSKRGGFKETTPDELLAAVMTAVLNDVKLSPEQLGDICVGNVLQPGAGAMMARIGQFLSGIPETVPISSVNRQCSSGLQALINIAGGIRNGSYDIGLACGLNPSAVPKEFFQEVIGLPLFFLEDASLLLQGTSVLNPRGFLGRELKRLRGIKQGRSKLPFEKAPSEQP